MKELTIEEKAKAYDKALERARIWKDKSGMPKDKQGILDDIFPELKESEDERIRNFISNELAFLRATDEKGTVRYNELTKAIDWLERQGEHKLADKVEPKFKVGDWVMLDRPVLITKVEDMPYNTHHYWTSDGTWFGDATKAKLWTIKDAKDGDVLATDDGVCIFDGSLEEGKYPFAYCGITERCFESYNRNLPFSHDNNIHPATKKQCDTLMKAMTDAGYTFDFEKKELKKIEQKHTEWSEEDEKMINCIIDDIYLLNSMATKEETVNFLNKEIDWLKSLKQNKL